MKTISLKIPESLAQQLKHAAAESGVNKSELLRLALERYLGRDKRANKKSVAALAGDLAGCISGPGDLSTNAAHFDEFGK